MESYQTKRNELLAAKVIKDLSLRRMHGYYAPSAKDALALALSLIPEGSSVSMGGGMSIQEICLKDALIQCNYRFIDRDKMGIAGKRIWPAMTVISSYQARMACPTMA